VAQFELFKRLFGSSSERREKPRVNAREGTRMLIVDDSPTIVAMLRKFLLQNGYQTLEAGDAEKGVEIASAERPDMIFLDIVLPGMNGFAALRQLRRDPVTREIPIIMISGNEQATEQFYAQRIGADDFMKKPFSRSEVFARIERLLDAEQVPKRPAPPPIVAPPVARLAVWCGMGMRSAAFGAFISGILLLGGCARVLRPPTEGNVPPPVAGPRYETVQGRNAALVARLRAAPAPAQPELSDGRSRPGDENLLLAQGFVQVGVGYFPAHDSGRAREQARDRGREVGAEKVMLYEVTSELIADYYVRLQLPFGANFRDLTTEERSVLGASGVQIGSVVGGTPAAKANLLDGDFVLKFNHASVADKAAFQSLLQEHMGRRVTLTVRRAGATIERIVRLGMLPAETPSKP